MRLVHETNTNDGSYRVCEVTDNRDAPEGVIWTDVTAKEVQALHNQLQASERKCSQLREIAVLLVNLAAGTEKANLAENILWNTFDQGAPL